MFLSKVKFGAIVVLAVGFAVSGVGLHGPLEAVVVNAEAAAPAPAKPNPSDASDPVERIHFLRDKLNQPVDYPGIDDARATFADVLDHLSKRFSIPFHGNDQAFRAMDPKIDVLRFPIAETPIPAMRASLKTVLHTVLARLPAKMGVMYVIRNDHIEITTKTAVRAELRIPANRPLLPLVCETLANTPLNAALRRLAHQSGYNVVIDPRVAEKFQIQASAEFVNVPIDTAVRLLANMAGQSVVQLDNVLYVTTADNAKKLREEQAEINADAPAKNTETPKKPASEKRAK